MTRLNVLLAALSIAAVATGAAGLVWGQSATGSTPAGAMAQLSNQGRPVDPGPGQTREMANVGATGLSLLARRDGRTFYRLATPDGGVCYAVTSVADQDHVGNTTCPATPTAFPTPTHPVLDLTVFESTTHDRDDFHVFRSEGFAADGVATVALLDEDDRVVVRRRASDNVYAVDVPPGRVATTVAAYDAEGAEVFRVP